MDSIADNFDVVYKDDATGDLYAYIGGQFVQIAKGTKGEEARKELERKEAELRDKEAKENGTWESDDVFKERVSNIYKDMDDKETWTKSIQKEAERRKAEKEEKREKRRSEVERQLHFNEPAKKLKLSVQRMISRQVSDYVEYSYKYVNKKHAGENAVYKGHRTKEQDEPPTLYVYFDRSGSWDDEDKIKEGKAAVAGVRVYERQQLLTTKTFYFSTKVSTDWDDTTGGTSGECILTHIQSEHPDNVLIMTDDGCDDVKSHIKVPGCVWFVWKGGITEEFPYHLKGDQGTFEFNLDKRLVGLSRTLDDDEEDKSKKYKVKK